MARYRYEVDQVRRKGDKDFDGSILKEDVSVPINIAYNHHHDLSIVGAGSRMERVPYDPNDPSVPVMMKADPNFVTMPVEHTPSLLGIPTSAGLHEGNGGEYPPQYPRCRPQPWAWHAIFPNQPPPRPTFPTRARGAVGPDAVLRGAPR